MSYECAITGQKVNVNGISYDINVSNLSLASNSRGGLEFSVRLVTPNPFGSAGGVRHSRY